jgi:RNA polymerase sigma-70 factor, ECF subfamily
VEGRARDPVDEDLTIDKAGKLAACDGSDSDLVAAVIGRRDDALAELYRRHAASVAATTRMILGAGPGCDDVVAEVFLGLWLHPSKFDPARGSLLGFLRLKARSCSIDLLRSETSRKRREEADRYAGTGPEPDIDSGVLASEAAEELRRAVASLPPGEASAIELAFFQGMSYSAVAVHLNIAEGTAKSRIRRGLHRLSRDTRSHGGTRASGSVDADDWSYRGQHEPA